MGNVKKLPHRGKYWQGTPEGVEVPIPKRKDFLRDRGNAAKPKDDDSPQPKPSE